MRTACVALLLCLLCPITKAQEQVPKLTSIRTTDDKKHVGEVLEQTDEVTVLYDIVLRDTVSIAEDQIKAFTEDIDERQAKYHVPFAVYATWKLIKLMKSGTIQGNIASASDQGVYINLGTGEAIEVGQQVKLLGAGEVITDPETEEVLAVVRPTVATMNVVQVVNEKLSKVELEVQEAEVDFERGMLVQIERPAKTVILIPPKWKSEDPKLKTGDEALYLTEHVLAELVRSGVHVISRDQVERVREDLAKIAGIAGDDVAAMKIAEELNAGIMLNGGLLAKGRFGEVFLHATDVRTSGLLGILNGRITRSKIKDEALKASKLQLRIQRKTESLPPLAIEMMRRTNILTQLIEGGCKVVVQVPNGATVTYDETGLSSNAKKLPETEDGFPPVFDFSLVYFRDGNAHLAGLLSGQRVGVLGYNLTDSKPEYFHVLNNRVQVVKYLHIYAPVEEGHIQIVQPRLTQLLLGDDSRLSAKWFISQYLPKLHSLGVGAVASNKLPAIASRLPTSLRAFYLSLHHLIPGWVNNIPPSIVSLAFDTHRFPQTERNRKHLYVGLNELKNWPPFRQSLLQIYLNNNDPEANQDRSFNDHLIESLLLSPAHFPAALRKISLKNMILSPHIKARLHTRYPKSDILWK